MWKKLLNTEVFLIFQENNDLELYITDFITIWRNKIDKWNFIKSMKESNPRLEIEDTELLNKGIDMLKKPEELKDCQTSVDTLGNLKFSIMKSFGFPVRLVLTLNIGPKELFLEKVTSPLLQSLADLQKSQYELCQLLLRKDKEIQEYKEEGGRIALRHLKTPKFDESKHLSAHSNYSRYFDFPEIPQVLIDRINSVQVKIKEEPQDKKPVVNNNEQIKEEIIETVEVKQEINSQSSILSASPRKKPRKLLNL